MKRHSYTRFARPYKADQEDKTRKANPRWEYGLIRYDSAASGTNPDDSKAEHSEYILYGLELTYEAAVVLMAAIELPADAKPLHRESRAVGVPASVWSRDGGGATPSYRGQN